MLDLYLRELELDLANRLSVKEAQVLLAEARAHLEQSIQARLELGSTREEAERVALAAFGRRETLVEALSDAQRARFFALRLWGLAGFTAVNLASLVLFVLTDWEWIAVCPLATLWLGAAWFAILGFRARRPAPIPLALGGVAVSLAMWIALSLSFLNLAPHGGNGNVFRWGARETILARIGRHPPVVRTWTERDPSGRDSTFQEVRAIPVFDDSDLDAVARAEADPVGNALSQVGGAFSWGMALASGEVAFDLVGAGLAFLWSQGRRRRSYA